jgi:segregation and condensation protein A
MLLPRSHEEEDEESDPRAELIRRLQEYERYKQAAEDLHERPQIGRDIFQTVAEVPDKHIDRPPPDIDLKELLLALRDVMHRADLFSSHQVTREPLSLRARMSRVLELVQADRFIEFTVLFDITEGRQGVVVTFMAVLELLKQSLIELVQSEPFAPIHVKGKSN